VRKSCPSRNPDATNPLLAAALASKADMMITGDKELLALERLQNLRILSPRSFWSLLVQ